MQHESLHESDPISFHESPDDECSTPTNISSLPPELLHEIFRSLVSLPSDSDKDDNKPDTWSLPFSISHVCQVWRDLSLDQPHFWTSLSLDIPLRHDPNFLNLWVDRSQDLPFQIALHDSGENDMKTNVQRTRVIIPLLSKVSPRLRSLRFHSSGNYHLVFPRTSEVLEEASFRCGCRTYDDQCVPYVKDRFWGYAEASPYFRRASFSHALPSRYFKWRNLTSITFHRLHPTLCLDSLPYCTVLEELSLEELEYNSEHRLPSGEIVLPHLVRLHVEGMWSTKPLSNLICPNLSNLTCGRGEILDDHHCTNMLSNSSANITTLRFHEWPRCFHIFNLVKFLNIPSLAHLEVLDMQNTICDVDIFQYLVGTDKYFPLPFLKELFLKLPQHFDGDSAIECVKKRQDINNTRGQTSKKLKVHLYRSSSPSPSTPDTQKIFTESLWSKDIASQITVYTRP